MTPDEARQKADAITDGHSGIYGGSDISWVNRPKLRDAIAAALLEAAGEWNADMDAAPKDGTWVLLMGGKTTEYDYMRELRGEVMRPVVAAWKANSGDCGGKGNWVFCYWDGAWRDGYESPSHWMPLPPPPSTQDYK